MIISLDMYQTLFCGGLRADAGPLFEGARIGFLEKFCIPAPVIGGVLFAVFTCLCYVTGIAEFEFDDILKEVCMVFFLHLGGLSGQPQGAEKRRQIADPLLGAGRCADFVPELPRRRAGGSAGHLAADRSVHRFHPDGRRPRHGGRVRPRARGLRRCGRDHALHGGGHLRPDRGQRHGRSDGPSAH